MILHESCNKSLQAMSPFTVGETEILLIPNQLNRCPPSVLVMARYRGRTMSIHLSPGDVRRFGAYLQAVADEAEALTRFQTGQ